MDSLEAMKRVPGRLRVWRDGQRDEGRREERLRPRVGEWRTQGSEGLGYGGLEPWEILDVGERDFFGPASSRAEEVELGMMGAKGLAAERGRVAFTAGGHDVATFGEHIRAPWGCTPYLPGGNILF